MNPHQANLHPTFFYSTLLRFNPTPTFLGITFNHILFFSRHVSSLKAKFFPRLKAFCCISASSWGPSMESLFLSLLHKAFLLLLLSYASTGCFSFLSVTNFTKFEHLHQAASRAFNGCISSSAIPFLLFKASLFPLRVTLTSRSL